MRAHKKNMSDVPISILARYKHSYTVLQCQLLLQTCIEYVLHWVGVELQTHNFHKKKKKETNMFVLSLTRMGRFQVSEM